MNTSISLLKDVIDIPTHVDAADYVLQLHSGVEAAEKTLGEYVVTDSLAKSFDDALGLVERSVVSGRSNGAFVHGSFGAGKSHFMAVLHLLLAGNLRARQLANLQSSVAARQGLLSKKLLAVDYHLLGAENFESALFRGYLDQTRKLHPEAPAAVLHRSDELFTDAANMRKELGDGHFFRILNSNSKTSSGWGDFAASWDGERFDAALLDPVGSADRNRLAQDLIATLFKSYENTGRWLDISSGLRAMTEHAHGLGYDGVVLFLDELVLWLAQHLGNNDFIQSETSKVAKLVETGAGSLTIPLISFVARQRDLKDFLGSTAIGAEREAIGQSFSWWEDRFEAITLKAADLPRIVNQRLLQPMSDEGSRALANATASVKANPGAMRHLLSDEAGSSAVDFELVYPFSPALIDALVALSSLLQRERTALKVMGELLSAGREQLLVTDVIPVGDLFESVVLSDKKPLSSDIEKLFQIAADFYLNKLRPYLLSKHGLTETEAAAVPRTHAFVAEDRLAKTLLVAEIVPGTPSLQNLTAAKLAALNYGTIKSFIPGQEATAVLQKVRDWSGEFGEINVAGSSSDPVLSVSLSGVDYDSVVDRVQNEDTEGARQAVLRNLVSEFIGLPPAVGLMSTREFTHVWRGTKRSVDVVFGNIRDASALPDDALRADGDRWKVVIDVPFDSGNHSAQEDLNRLAQLRDAGLESRTIAWVPHFLSAARLNDVGRLVLLEHLLKGSGEQFEANASNLPVSDRPIAKRQLESQRANIKERLKGALLQAYGIDTATADDVDAVITADSVFTSLFPGLEIQLPVAADLRGGLNLALGQALTYLHPKHPLFEPSETEIRKTELLVVASLVEDCISKGGRLDGIERSKAATLRRVAMPLHLGEPRESVYSLNSSNFGWMENFTKWAAAEPLDVNIPNLRSHLEDYGVSTEVGDLLILAWSLLEDRQWFRAQAPLPSAPTVGSITSDMSLRTPDLPSAEDWTTANRRAPLVFGIPAEPRLSAQGVSRLARQIRQAASDARANAHRLVEELQRHAKTLGLNAATPRPSGDRLRTAEGASVLTAALASEANDTSLIRAFAAAAIPDEPQALGTSLASASAVLTALRAAEWKMLNQLTERSESEWVRVLETMQTATAADELHAPLAPAIAGAQAAALNILMRQPPVSPPATTARPEQVEPTRSEDREQTPEPHKPATEPSKPVDSNDEGTLAKINAVDLILNGINADLGQFELELKRAMNQNPGKTVHVKWWIE
ncbi:hypothetical protein ABLI39_09370 [Pseudarthrobacter sp. B907]|uniref:hypothetical protein n=1 Tax=Pseudarthrobacter sp. B907 TaxID=3158261 RepID=UPI0032DADC5D